MLKALLPIALFLAGAPTRADLIAVESGYAMRVIFSTHGHRMSDGSAPPGNFDGLTWIPRGPGPLDGWLFVNHELPLTDSPSGGVSRLTLAAGTVASASAWATGLNRPCSSHASPWGTVLVGEEDDTAADGRWGHVVELRPGAPGAVRRPALGRMRHENCVPDPRTGVLYTTDDARPTDGKGALYRFIPTRPGDLSAGRLEAWKAHDGATGLSSSGGWVGIADPAKAQEEARTKRATLYDRPEDLVWNPVDRRLYIAMTGDDKHPDPARRLGAIYRLDPDRAVMERWLASDGAVMAMPDNLEVDGTGRLLVAEDQEDSLVKRFGPNELIAIGPDRAMTVVLRGDDPYGEVTGVLSMPDGNGFWVVWQHGRDPYSLKAAGAPYSELYEVRTSATSAALPPAAESRPARR